MKAFVLLLVALSTLHFIPVEAHQHIAPAHQKKQRIYLNPQDLYFSDEGIFWLDSHNEWIPINNLEHDAHGTYFIVAVPNCRATCTRCGKVYAHEVPPRCGVCGNPYFNLLFHPLHHNVP